MYRVGILLQRCRQDRPERQAVKLQAQYLVDHLLIHGTGTCSALDLLFNVGGGFVLCRKRDRKQITERPTEGKPVDQWDHPRLSKYYGRELCWSSIFPYRIALLDRNQRDFERYECFIAVDDQNRSVRPRIKTLRDFWRTVNKGCVEYQ